MQRLAACEHIRQLSELTDCNCQQRGQNWHHHAPLIQIRTTGFGLVLINQTPILKKLNFTPLVVIQSTGASKNQWFWNRSTNSVQPFMHFNSVFTLLGSRIFSSETTSHSCFGRLKGWPLLSACSSCPSSDARFEPVITEKNKLYVTTTNCRVYQK